MTKAALRRKFVALLRPSVRRIQTFGATTDAHRGNLGITIPDPIRTPVGAPRTRPLVNVDFSERFLHRIQFVDEKTSTRRARPGGVMGAEVWVKVTNPAEGPPEAARIKSGVESSPTDPGDFKFLLLATRSPAVAEYAGKDAGKTAHYMLRWFNRRGEPGPWSGTASATVGV